MNYFLHKCLSWVRPAYSGSEQAFVDWLEFEIKSMGYNYEIDGYGNLWVKQGSSTLLTCHTDTVAYDEVNTTTTQDIKLTGNIISLATPSHGSVLGADDGAGCAILLELLKSNAPYDYVFFRAEEVGGVGSTWAVKHNPTWFDNYQRAIAFDRRGTQDIITHQYSERCCSNEFAQQLADQLSLDYAPSDLGIFTDTANLTHLVAECTNVSVGYANEHQSRETLDYGHWSKLLESLLKIDLNALGTWRDPNEVESRYTFADDEFWFNDAYDYCEPDDDEQVNFYAWEDLILNQELDGALTLVWNFPEYVFEFIHWLVRNGYSAYINQDTLTLDDYIICCEVLEFAQKYNAESFYDEYVYSQPDKVARALFNLIV